MRGRRRPVTFRVLAAIVFKAHPAFVLVESIHLRTLRWLMPTALLTA
jgi:hypothetical protein